MSVAIVTGAAGLVGSHVSRMLCGRGVDVVGVDNFLRRSFFGEQGCTAPEAQRLVRDLPRYTHRDIDIRDTAALEQILAAVGGRLHCVVHAAAQPSHDHAAADPLSDFAVNATATLGLLELVRRYSPQATFVYLSTNKVYGDRINDTQFQEYPTRFDVEPTHPLFQGVDEDTSVDLTTHSIFGVGKLASDLAVQEYGRYFGLNTICLRSGCITGRNHAATEQHGFLAYLARCARDGIQYRVYGHGGKQVRDNIHAADIATAIWEVLEDPRPGLVFNIGGGRANSCSVLEAAESLASKTGLRLALETQGGARVGDHKWWITDNSRFRAAYPRWRQAYSLEQILNELAQ